ncbi:ABC transporter related protein [Hyphomicrobium denitrificans ATCC 51888]|uniref:ABC transporter related protein n=1 Tax=Hyphomicrobium denitrificans (strain ATCC 51888 / DSM 1869 / NCIMB 11706 / TK 0415) TaxID=582899 RepID=D8JZC1_HYPDA|nr:ABC transporter ATP-binding protein [Hyphomicrobium denitrificans]ADJ23723.1 ABC transporter related protein [Hyphomicrobium denitrificans ATCC 51888]MBN9353354.1 ABC transporter ATP-binding protein [Hyphomicrobium denitrificans]
METSPAGTTFSPILQLEGVTRSFRQGEREIVVLKGVDAVLWPGQAVALVGPSGAGKSTLLHITGLLESPTSGRVFLNGRDCATLSEGERTRLRRKEIGFVYQFHQLLPEFSALENVVLPQLILGRARKAAEARALALLSGLGLGERANHRPAELSGGEQQRAAICRGLANSPKLLLADEPTGNLDPHTSEYVFRELIDLIRHQGVAALIATHNLELARRMDRVLQMHEGRLVELAPASVGR